MNNKFLLFYSLSLGAKLELWYIEIGQSTADANCIVTDSVALVNLAINLVLFVLFCRLHREMRERELEERMWAVTSTFELT